MAAVSACVIAAPKPTLRSMSDIIVPGIPRACGLAYPSYRESLRPQGPSEFISLWKWRQKAPGLGLKMMKRLEISQYRSRLATKRRKGPDQSEHQRDDEREQRGRNRRPALPFEREGHHVGDDAPSRDRAGHHPE